MHDDDDDAEWCIIIKYILKNENIIKIKYENNIKEEVIENYINDVARRRYSQKTPRITNSSFPITASQFTLISKLLNIPATTKWPLTK